MQYHNVGLNPLLAASPTGTAYSCPVPIVWDIRDAPRAVGIDGQAVAARGLTELATSPGLPTLYIISGLLAVDWVVVAHNPSGVTIGDILSSIYTSLRVPLRQSEWECMSPVQQARIQDVFYTRCEASRDFDRARNGGVRRMDCLLHTTVFGGLSSLVFRNNRWEVVLTLSRDFGAHGRS